MSNPTSDDAQSSAPLRATLPNEWWRKAIPSLEWLGRYERKWLRADIAAGRNFVDRDCFFARLILADDIKREAFAGFFQHTL